MASRSGLHDFHDHDFHTPYTGDPDRLDTGFSTVDTDIQFRRRFLSASPRPEEDYDWDGRDQGSTAHPPSEQPDIFGDPPAPPHMDRLQSQRQTGPYFSSTPYRDDLLGSYAALPRREGNTDYTPAATLKLSQPDLQDFGQPTSATHATHTRQGGYLRDSHHSALRGPREVTVPSSAIPSRDRAAASPATGLPCPYDDYNFGSRQSSAQYRDGSAFKPYTTPRYVTDGPAPHLRDLDRIIRPTALYGRQHDLNWDPPSSSQNYGYGTSFPTTYTASGRRSEPRDVHGLTFASTHHKYAPVQPHPRDDRTNTHNGQPGYRSSPPLDQWGFPGPSRSTPADYYTSDHPRSCAPTRTTQSYSSAISAGDRHYKSVHFVDEGPARYTPPCSLPLSRPGSSASVRPTGFVSPYAGIYYGADVPHTQVPHHIAPIGHIEDSSVKPAIPMRHPTGQFDQGSSHISVHGIQDNKEVLYPPLAAYHSPPNGFGYRDCSPHSLDRAPALSSYTAGPGAVSPADPTSAFTPPNRKDMSPRECTRQPDVDSRYSSTANHNQPSGYAPRQPDVKPPQFSGSTSWDDYLSQFETLATLAGWSPHAKAAQLAASLRGSAQAVLSDMDSHRRCDYVSLVEALGRRFGSDDAADLYKIQFKARYQQKDESLPELAQAVRRLARLAYPSLPATTQSEFAKDQFLEALQEADIRWRLKQTRPRTLDEALKSAIELEAIQESERQRGGPRRQVRAVSYDNSSSRGRNKNNRPQWEPATADESHPMTDSLAAMLAALSKEVKNFRDSMTGDRQRSSNRR